MQTANPVLSNKTFDGFLSFASPENTMSVSGTVNKTGAAAGLRIGQCGMDVGPIFHDQSGRGNAAIWSAGVLSAWCLRW